MFKTILITFWLTLIGIHGIALLIISSFHKSIHFRCSIFLWESWFDARKRTRQNSFRFRWDHQREEDAWHLASAPASGKPWTRCWRWSQVRDLWNNTGGRGVYKEQSVTWTGFAFWTKILMVLGAKKIITRKGFIWHSL